jgi:hypothetical protein
MLLDFRKAEQKDLPAARMDDAILVQNHLVYPLVLYTLHRPGLGPWPYLVGFAGLVNFGLAFGKHDVKCENKLPLFTMLTFGM